MVSVTVIGYDGAERDIEAEDGFTLMEAIRDAGFDELIAQCGGCCSCATCHVYIDPSWTNKVGPPEDMEEEMLDVSEHRQENSRLSCQINVNAELEGLRVTIAPED